jgi:hypothetical protein
MASSTNYGSRFEALVADACKDFGAKLIRSWDQGADKAEIRAFVDEAVKTFFALDAASGARVSSLAPTPSDPEPESESAPAPAPKPKAKAPAPAAAKPKGKGKAPTKPKCQALTAKGAPCSKCAVEGSTFCSVHNAVTTKAKGKGKAPAKAPPAKGKGKKKAVAETTKSVPASVKHTHGLDELDHEDCDLCKSHGAPFELPDYEAGTSSSSVPAPAPNKKTWADDAEDDDDATYDPLAEEEDASEIGSDGGGGGLSEEDFDEDY